MPRNSSFVRYGLLSQFDATQWAGVNVYDRGAANVTLPVAYGVFDDVVEFLNDYGSIYSLETLAQVAMDAAPSGPHGTWIVSIDEDDRVYIERDNGGFLINASAANAHLGFAAAGAWPVNTTGTVWRATATSDWTRGEFSPSAHLSILVGGDTVTFGSIQQVQDVPVYLRTETTSLQGTDDASGLGTGLIRWGVGSDGHAWCSYPSARTDIAWVDTAFRDRIGFSGNEIPVVSGGIDVLTGDYPVPGVIIPSRPADKIGVVSEDVSTAATLSDNSVASNYVATLQRVSVVGWLDGPADDVDLHRHWQVECRPYLHRGAPCVLYQDWGDSRLALWRPTGHYSTVYTAEPISRYGDGGYRGRIVGYMASTSPATYEPAWPQRVMRRAPFAFAIQGGPVHGS